jgi:alkyl sulfatase BDS1-like metallo-beta-lactamase superfamily hydrolase
VHVQKQERRPRWHRLSIKRLRHFVIGRQGGVAASKEAEPPTLKANADMAASLPFADTSAVQDARRGLVATLPNDFVPGNNGKPLFSPNDFSFIDKDDAPKMVNPSLARQARLNTIHGLVKVVDRVYQVRGYDISNMIIIEGDTGIIIIDTLRVAETARAALDLYYQNRPRKPVVVVIYTAMLTTLAASKASSTITT